MTSPYAAAWPFPVGNKPGHVPSLKSAQAPVAKSSPTTKTADRRFPVPRTRAPVGKSSPTVKTAKGLLSRERYTDDDIDIFAEMYVKSYNNSAIAKALGRTVKAILNQINDAYHGRTPTGIRLQKAIDARRASKNDPLAVATSNMIEKAQKVLNTASSPTNHRKPWTIEADHQLLLGFSSGMTPAALAAFCGRTKAAVAGRLHVLGVLTFDNVAMEFKTLPQVWLKVAASKA